MYQLEAQLLDFSSRCLEWPNITRETSFKQLITNLQQAKLPVNDRVYCIYCAATLIEDDCLSAALPTEIICQAVIAVISVIGSESSEQLLRAARHLLALLEELIDEENSMLLIVLTNTLQKQLRNVNAGCVNSALAILAELRCNDVIEACAEDALTIATTTQNSEALLLCLVVLSKAVAAGVLPHERVIGAFVRGLSDDPELSSQTGTAQCLLALTEHLPTNQLLIYVPRCFAVIAASSCPVTKTALVTFLKVLARDDIRVGAKLEPLLVDSVLKSDAGRTYKVCQVNALAALADLKPATKKSYEVSVIAGTRLFQEELDANVRVLCLQALRSLACAGKAAAPDNVFSEIIRFASETPLFVSSVLDHAPLMYTLLISLAFVDEPWFNTLIDTADVRVLRGCLPVTPWARDMLSQLYESAIRETHEATSELVAAIIDSNCLDVAMLILEGPEFVIKDIGDLEKLEKYVIQNKVGKEVLRVAARKSHVANEIHKCNSSLLLWLYVLDKPAQEVHSCCLKSKVRATRSTDGNVASTSLPPMVDTLGAVRSLFA